MRKRENEGGSKSECVIPREGKEESVCESELERKSGLRESYIYKERERERE